MVPRALILALGLALSACTGTDLFSTGPDAEPDRGGDVDVAGDTALDLGADVGGSSGDLGPYAPTLYRGDRLRSPVTPWVADTLAAIAETDTTRQDDVFMKVGASGTVNTNLLYCFAGEAQPQYTLDLDGRSHLMPTITFFRGGDAAGDTPFDRPTAAAVVGRSAVWAISGDPSPLETEIAAVNPRYAFINYGTNDMQLGTTYESALFPFYSNVSELLDQTMEAGIIPIVSGLTPRTDLEQAARWVPTYNVVTRGIAEARQVPYINLYLAMLPLEDYGLVSDGVHGNAYRVDGASQPCVFTADGLEFNYNVRNLLSVEMLDQVRRVVFEGATPEATTEVLRGAGTMVEPFVIDELPFTHYADTGVAGETLIAEYPSCDGGQDESGPEHRYALTLTETTPLRMMVFDLAGIDVDIHLLEGDDPADCLARNDRIVERTLAPGEYTIVVDTFVPSDGLPRDGAYLVVILACEPDDGACD